MIKTILSRITAPIFGVIDKAVVDRDQKKQLKQELELALIDTAEFFEEQITARHELDMKSDSWLSKNVRPLTLVFLMFVFVIMTFFDGNVGEFSLNESYIPVYQTLLSLVFTFYFGSRGAEKITKIYKERKDQSGAK